VLGPAGVELELGYRLRQSLALFRLALRSSAHSQGFGIRVRNRIQGQFLSGSCYYFHSYLRTYYLGLRPKTLKKTACSQVLGVRSQFRCEAPAGQAEGAANLGSDPKTPDPASESIPTAVWQGRAAQRQADQGERLSERSATERVRARPRLPRAAQGTRRALTSARLFLAYLILAKQKKVSRPPRRRSGTGTHQ
jgi:hypothetical protein